MPDNPFTRDTTVQILELVPQRDNLPRCAAWLLADATQCLAKARYQVVAESGVPMWVCGRHVGAPSLLFHPTAVKAARR